MRGTEICVIGGGGLGHTCSAMLSSKKGVSVNMLTNHPEKWSGKFVVNAPEGRRINGELARISRDPADVIPQSHVILFCLPSFLLEQTILQIRPFLKPNQIIGTVVGNSGFFLFCHKHLPPETKLFGFQRVPYISRVVEYGKEANLLGFKPELLVAMEGIGPQEEFRQFLENVFEEKVSVVGSFYEVTLSNSNPILHTGRLYTMWKDWDGTPFDDCGYFYRDWTDAASEIEIKMDAEFFELLKALGVNIENIKTLLTYYDSFDAQSLSNKIRSIPSFSEIRNPVKQTPDGRWIPDTESRYFAEDFYFGLHFIWQLCHEHNVPCPTIDTVYQWGVDFSKH